MDEGGLCRLCVTAIGKREFNDIKTQAREAGMIPVGSTAFDNWNDALAHAGALHSRGEITAPEFADFQRNAQFSQGPQGEPRGGGILDRITSFMQSISGGSGKAY
jgi:hypothetical protein